jgi:hypothetical protein
MHSAQMEFPEWGRLGFRGGLGIEPCYPQQVNQDGMISKLQEVGLIPI